MFVQAPENAEAELGSLPGVAYVERLRPLKRHLSRALDLSNVSAAWSAVNGPQNAGAGVRIAIIDTGIDHTHPAFEDSGLQYPAGFPKCQERSGDCAYVNRKVIVARSYVSMLVGSDPVETRPDDLSPRDRVGHGTAVAMIAAGRRNTGPAGTIEGVAPAAFLGNYKVFGSPGVNDRYTYDDVIIQAMDDAIADGMNVAVLSLGSPAFWGPRDRGATCDFEGTRACDWRAEAAEYAGRLGLTLVVSAGNTGDVSTRWPAFNSVETPGTAPSAITVGAITNSHILYQSLTVEGPNVPANVRRLNTLFGNGPRPGGPLTAEVRDAGSACEPLGNGTLQGVFALIPRGDCQLALVVQNAQRAGAIGAIIYQREGFQGVFPMRGLEETGIPAVLIGNQDSTALKTYIASNPNARVTLDPALTSVQTT
ncbi:MAG TPA: S8 family serine peptidase, partial [Opitutus sp.]|nr:S8 family serine peptidase [Opitutus sp.]